jgi:hypothetical protein
VIAVLNSSGNLVMESIVETQASSILQFIHGLRGELHVTWGLAVRSVGAPGGAGCGLQSAAECLYSLSVLPRRQYILIIRNRFSAQGSNRFCQEDKGCCPTGDRRKCGHDAHDSLRPRYGSGNRPRGTGQFHARPVSSSFLIARFWLQSRKLPVLKTPHTLRVFVFP